MIFKSSWITTEEFYGLSPLDMYHKEAEKKLIPKSFLENYHAYFRKKFFKKDNQKTYIKISADDYYRLYINGKFVCQGPGSAYPENYNYNNVDISSFTVQGENIIAVHVFYHGRINRSFFSGDNRMGLIAEIYSDKELICVTDQSWLYKQAMEFSGETIGYDTQFLENIDFNLKDSDFKEFGADESEYKNAVINPKDDHVFKQDPIPFVDEYCVSPTKIIRLEKGKYLFEFATQISARLYMKIKGKKGQKIRILCGEELLEGSLYVRSEMRCTCTYDETLILSGGEDEVEFFDYKIFRYVNIFTDEDFDTSCVSAMVRHHRFTEKIRLHSDIPHLNSIWEICKNSVKYASQESILDCVSREKGAYLGDFLISGLSHFYLTGDKDYFKKNLYDYAHSARVSKSLMSVANASHMQEFADYSLVFPLQVQNYLTLTGDCHAVADLFPVLEGILEEFKVYERDDGLLDNVIDKQNLVDWPLNLRDGYDAKIDRNLERIDCHNVLNAFYIGAYKAVEEISKKLDIAFEKRSDYLVESYIKAFYNPQTGLFCDTQTSTHSSLHSNALPLFFSIARPEMQDTIKDFIMKKGLSCGVYMAYFVLKGLGRIGAYEDELELLINESEHSWVNMLREGATTCFEAWGKEQKWNTSLCHPWASAPIIVICEDLSGKKFDKGTISVCHI